ncbi:MAG TPA: DUF6056 family protein [Patescibacteria group bacterium]|nr:DUF6056 family protein [Patescibacteria group bacterium]
MKKVVTFSLITFSLLGLLKIFSIIPFNRLAADDFGYAYMAKTSSFFQAQMEWYTGWTGRFTSTLLQSLFGLASGDSGKAVVYSVITFASLLLALILFFKKVLNLKMAQMPAFLLSTVSFVSLYVLTPNKKESWYWLSGSVTYLWPIIFLIFGVSYLFVKKPMKVDYILAFLFIFFAGGGNETLSLLSCLILAIFLIYSFVSKKLNKLLVTMFVGSAFSFALVYLSPGNMVRAVGGGSDQMSLLGSLIYAIQTGPMFLYSLVWNNLIFILPLFFCLAYFFSTLIIEQALTVEDLVKKIFYLSVAPVFISIIYMLPSFKVLGRIPPDRSNITLAFVLLTSLTISAFYLGSLFNKIKNKSSFSFAITVLIFSIMMFATSFTITSSLASDVYIAKNYSSAFDRVVSEVKAAANAKKQGIIIVDMLPESGLIGSADLKGYSNNEKNNAIARYYGIEALIAK